MSWDRLNELYASRGIAMAIAAGVSVGSKLPSWVELLRRVGAACAGESGTQLVDGLRAEGFGLPAIAGMLRNMCADDQRFPEIVRESLYRDLPVEIRRAGQAARPALVEFVQEANPTLRCVAALCAERVGHDRGFRRNDRLHGIVNFNVDAVFRKFVEARYGHPLLVRTIERPSKSPNQAKVSVYHPHGYLRFDRKAGRSDREASDKLVLAEQEYFDTFNSPTGFFNYTVLHLLRTHHFVFLGLSMQDDNLRRLLHYSVTERRRAYQDEGASARTAQENSIRHFAIQKRTGNAQIDDAIERSLHALGAFTLWIDEYHQLSGKLGTMYSSTGAGWGSVY
jgi:hypothetical protein